MKQQMQDPIIKSNIYNRGLEEIKQFNMQFKRASDKVRMGDSID